MRKARTRLLVFLLGAGLVTLRPGLGLMAIPQNLATAAQQDHNAALQPISSKAADIPFPDAEFAVEQRLLELANESRRQAGAPPLRLDPGLSHAALRHAQVMLEAGQLSHQFQGEPSLPQRLAATPGLRLDQEGENVAFDYDADHGHQHLMLSPPHRANLLNPAYNVVGLGVVRSGDRLYIVQDFARALPDYSPAEVKDRIAATVSETRHQAGQSDLLRHDLPGADDAACSMAQADKLSTASVRKLSEHFSVLSYTSLHPETLPGGAAHAVGSGNLRSFSLGTCYGRSDTYPTGVYWIVLTLE